MFEGKIGFEIECCISNNDFNTGKPVIDAQGWQIGSDGSVSSRRNNSAYELRGKVYNLTEKEQIFTDIEALFAYITEVNNSAGLHIHLSFKNSLNYWKLCSWKFVDAFQKLIEKKFKTKAEKARISRHYCEFYKSEEDFNNIATQQTLSTGKDSSRYKAINFNAFNLYKTIEFRIFPATNNPKKFKKYVEMLTEFVDEYLQQADAIQMSFDIDNIPKSKSIKIEEVM